MSGIRHGASAPSNSSQLQSEDLLLDLLTIGDKPVYWRVGIGAGTINAVGNGTLNLSGGIAGTGFPLVLTGTSDVAENGAITGAAR